MISSNCIVIHNYHPFLEIIDNWDKTKPIVNWKVTWVIEFERKKKGNAWWLMNTKQKHWTPCKYKITLNETSLIKIALQINKCLFFFVLYSYIYLQLRRYSIDYLYFRSVGWLSGDAYSNTEFRSALRWQPIWRIYFKSNSGLWHLATILIRV